jgi:hypothetical protein
MLSYNLRTYYTSVSAVDQSPLVCRTMNLLQRLLNQSGRVGYPKTMYSPMPILMSMSVLKLSHWPYAHTILEKTTPALMADKRVDALNVLDLGIRSKYVSI